VASGPRGALIGAAACCALRHKTRKESFQKKYGLSILASFALDRFLKR